MEQALSTMSAIVSTLGFKQVQVIDRADGGYILAFILTLEFQALSGLYSRPVALRLASLTLNHLKTHLYSFVLSLLYK